MVANPTAWGGRVGLLIAVVANQTAWQHRDEWQPGGEEGVHDGEIERHVVAALNRMYTAVER